MTVGSLNLPLPLGFRGLDPDLPIALYHRNLPHWRQTGATYFVTFRQADALPQEKLRWLKRLREEWERTHPPPRSDTDWRTYAREVTNSAERWLDQGYGECHFRHRRSCEDLSKRLHRFQDRRFIASRIGATCSRAGPSCRTTVMRCFDRSRDMRWRTYSVR